MSKIKAVVIGGGTGAPTSIRTLLDMNCEVTSIVSMVDDGGSTGILRERGGVVPPGDVRKCISAMSANYDGIIARMFRHRFAYLDDHSLGNLMLTALAEEAQSFPDAIRVCEGLVEARGHVHPSTLRDVTLSGMTDAGEQLEGQAVISDASCCMRYVSLSPADAQAYPPALAAIRSAELIVLGPGSLFTSIIPNLLVEGVVQAIAEARTRPDRPAYTVFVCSLADMQGETWGMSCYDHVEALLRHGMRGILDIALIHRNAEGSGLPSEFAPTADYAETRFTTRGRRLNRVSHVLASDELVERVRALGVQPMVRDLVDEARPTWHSREKLAKAFSEVLSACHSQQR